MGKVIIALGSMASTRAPARPCACLRMSAWMASCSSRMRRACGSIIRASSVGSTPAAPRTNKGAPTSRSSVRIVRLRAWRDTKSPSLARPNDPSSNALQNASSAWMSTKRPLPSPQRAGTPDARRARKRARPRTRWGRARLYPRSPSSHMRGGAGAGFSRTGRQGGAGFSRTGRQGGAAGLSWAASRQASRASRTNAGRSRAGWSGQTARRPLAGRRAGWSDDRPQVPTGGREASRTTAGHSRADGTEQANCPQVPTGGREASRTTAGHS